MQFGCVKAEHCYNTTQVGPVLQFTAMICQKTAKLIAGLSFIKPLGKIC